MELGSAGFVETVVKEDDTAEVLGSGNVPVLGTPRIISLVEEASCKAVEGQLAAGSTTVGMRVQLDHLLPVPVGALVRAESTLERTESQRLIFTVSVSCDRGLVAVGKITRVVVDRERFLERAR